MASIVLSGGKAEGMVNESELSVKHR